MSKAPQKALLILKRYGVPILITFGVYTAFYFLCGKDTKYINVGLWIALLYACLMRFCDDITDYEKDVKADKAPIKRSVLIIGVCLATIAIFLLTAFGGVWWMLLPLVLISLLFILKGLPADIIKPFFTPTVVLVLTISVFEINLFTWILSALLVIIDGLFVYKGRKK